MIQLQNKRYFTDAEIEEIRSRFTVEKAVDEALTWKLQRRRGGDYHSLKLGEIGERLHAFLACELNADYFQIRDLKRLPGGASKEQFIFTLVRHDEEHGERVDRMVLRMNPAGSSAETHRLREFQILHAVRHLVPVPPVYWVDPDGSKLGQPGMICGLVSGVAKPTQASSGKVSGIGVGFPVRLRQPLFDQFVGILAKIHRYDWQGNLADLSSYDVPKAGTTEAVLWNLESWRRIWEEDCLSEHPVMAMAYSWLKTNMPVVEEVCLLHCDYRSGNFLFDEESARITAVLDWELAHLGDVHEDLAWVLYPNFSYFDDEIGRDLVCGLSEREDFLERYQKITGISIDERRLAYYQILNAYKMAVIATATCVRIAADRQTHLDVMMNFGSGVGATAINELWKMIREEVCRGRAL